MAEIKNITVDSKIPEGPVAEKWTNYKAHQKLVNPANKRRLDVIVVGTGLAGASAASTLAEMGIPEEYIQEPVVEEAPAAPVAPEQPDTTVVNQEPANN